MNSVCDYFFIPMLAQIYTVSDQLGIYFFNVTMKNKALGSNISFISSDCRLPRLQMSYETP